MRIVLLIDILLYFPIPNLDPVQVGDGMLASPGVEPGPKVQDLISRSSQSIGQVSAVVSAFGTNIDFQFEFHE